MRYIALAALAIWATDALAAPRFQYADQNTMILLTDDPCKLDAIQNLPYRAVWRDKTGTYEGCWAGMDNLVIGYFSDKKVALFPANIFTRVTGA